MNSADLRAHYAGHAAAQRYVADRFSSELNRLLHERQVKVLNDLIATHGLTTVLDIAAGPARVAQYLAGPAAVICVEISAEMIEVGRAASVSSLAWVRADAFQLPLGVPVDLVYSFRFVRHFAVADRMRLYREVRRLLRPGGFFVIDAVNAAVSNQVRASEPELYPIPDALYEADALAAELHTAGFEVIAMMPMLKFYRWQRTAQILLGPRSAWLNRWVIRRLEALPRHNGLEWVVTCRSA